MRACGGRGELVSKVPETRRSAGPRAVVVSFPPARSAEWGRERGPGSNLASGLLKSPKKAKKTLRTRGMGTVWVRGGVSGELGVARGGGRNFGKRLRWARQRETACRGEGGAATLATRTMISARVRRASFARESRRALPLRVDAA